MSHHDWTGQRHLRFFDRIPRGEPIADTKVKSSFEPAWLLVDQDEFQGQVRWQFTIEILLLLKSSDRRRDLLFWRGTEPRQRREGEGGNRSGANRVRSSFRLPRR